METLFTLFIIAFLIGIISANTNKTNNKTIVSDKVYYHYHSHSTTYNEKVITDPDTEKKFDAIFNDTFNKHFNK